MKVKAQTLKTLQEYKQENGILQTTTTLGIPEATMWSRIRSKSSWYVIEIDGKHRCMSI